jgi:hypothetical protein
MSTLPGELAFLDMSNPTISSMPLKYRLTIAATGSLGIDQAHQPDQAQFYEL